MQGWDVNIQVYSEPIIGDVNNFTIDIQDSLYRNTKITNNGNNVINLIAPDGRTWTYHHNGDGLIRRIVEPEGKETIIRYSQSESNLPRIRQWSLNEFNPDTFVEIRYPTGGALRYEAVQGTGKVANGKILTTEFLDDRNPNKYYQKYISIDRYENEGITTKIYKNDGSVYEYFYTFANMNLTAESKKRIPLLAKRTLNPGRAGSVMDEYEWKVDRSKSFSVNGLLSQITTENGISYSSNYEYDSDGRVTKFTNKTGNSISFEYGTAENIEDPILKERVERLVKSSVRNKTNADGSIDRIRMNYYRTGADFCSGLVIPRTQINRISAQLNEGQEEIIKEYCFDLAGNVTKETELGGLDVKYFYENSVYLTIMEKDDGNTLLEYDKNIGKVSKITSSNGVSVNYTHNSAGQIKRIDYSNGSYINNDYNVRYSVNGNNNENSIITRVFDSARNNNITTERNYDGLDRLVRLKKGNNESRYSYGSNKRTSSIEYPGNKKYAFTYDGLDRLIAINYPGGKEVKYSYTPINYEGRFAHKLDIRLNDNLYSTLYRDADLKIISSVRYPDGIDNSTSTKYVYDEFDNIIKTITPENLITENVFDHHGRLRGRVYPNGDRVDINNISNESGLFDSFVFQDSNLGSSTTTFDYDSQNRVTNINYPSLNELELNDYNVEYSGQNISAISNANNRTMFEYTTDGILKTISQNIQGTEIDDSFEFGEDGFGLTSWIGYPDGTKIFYITDNQGRITEIQKGSNGNQVIANIEYDDSGNMQKMTFGNSSSNIYSYDENGNVIQIKITKGEKIINQISFLYDNWGNKSLISYLDGSKVEYEYDGLRRLIRVLYYKAEDVQPFNIQTYTYDKDGNRKTYSDAYKQIQYDEYESGLLKKLTIGTQTKKEFNYDIRGNLIEEKEKKQGREVFSRTFKYDYQDRLISANVDNKSGNISKLEYKYDYASRRAEKIVNGKAKRYYLYGKSTDPLMELNGNGEVERIFIYFGGRRIAVFEDENLEYYHLDDVGNVLHTTNDGGKVVETLRYDPFGNINFRVGLSNNRYHYNSKEYDNETGLIYYGARYYDPELGRFISRDPMEQGINHYIFAKNNPLNIEEYMGLGDVGDAFVSAFSFVVGGGVGLIVGLVSGDPMAGIQAGIATTLSILGQLHSTDSDGSFMVNMSFASPAPGVNWGSDIFNRVGINVGISDSFSSNNVSGSEYSVGNVCQQNRLCFVVGENGVSMGSSGNPGFSGSSFGGDSGNGVASDGSFSGNGSSSSGGGSSHNYGYSMAVETSIYDYQSPINTNPLNSPSYFPSYDQVFGNGATANSTAGSSLANVGLPSVITDVDANPVAYNYTSYNYSSNDNNFLGTGELPPSPSMVNVPLGFDQQDDTPISIVQTMMEKYSGE